MTSASDFSAALACGRPVCVCAQALPVGTGTTHRPAHAPERWITDRLAAQAAEGDE